MITDKIRNLKKYPETKPFAEDVLAFVKKTEEEHLEDGHMPGIAADEPKTVKKIVFKIKVD